MAISQPGSQPGSPARLTALSKVLLTAVSMGLVACSPSGDTVEITSTRLASSPSHPAIDGLTMMERAKGTSSQAEPAPRKPLLYDVPEGWEDLPPTQFRNINLRNISEPSTEMILSFLPNDAGGLIPNINRWRGQVGLGDMGPAEIAALTTRKVLGQEATYVELKGPYRGMTGDAIEDGALFGAVFSQGGGTLFVKMTGARAILEAESAGFSAFLDSIRFNPEVNSSPASDGGSAAQGQGSRIAWDSVPDWIEVPSATAFREVTFKKDGLEMYVSTAIGNPVDNITRWAGQMSQSPLDEAAVDALEKVQMMGLSGYIYETSGTYRGMGGTGGTPGQRMLAALVAAGGQIVTVKMVGEDAAVQAAKPAFMQLVSSLRPRS
ncbi:MAG: hypothetical protein ACJA2W_003874 [Planctomycetota bacterium]|jgi:hypothetical protein